MLTQRDIDRRPLVLPLRTARRLVAERLVRIYRHSVYRIADRTSRPMDGQLVWKGVKR